MKQTKVVPQKKLSMVGLFINTIPGRAKFAEEITFTRLLKYLQEDDRAGEPYHYCPLTDIREENLL